jgi:hypothetical protein
VYIYVYTYIYIYTCSHLRGNRIGIRELSGDKKQLFSFGGLSCKLDKEGLWMITTKILEDLESGGGYEAAAQRAKQLVKDGQPTDED